MTVKTLHVSGLLLSACGIASAAIVNLAPLGTASSSSTGFGGTSDLANDGNRDGVFGNGSVFHSAGGTGPGESYEIDLGSNNHLDRILLFGRTDQRQASVRDFNLEVFNGAGTSVYSNNFLGTANTGDDPWGVGLTGVFGQRVVLTLNNPNNTAVNFLAFAEMEIWGDSSPLPTNITGLAAISGGAGGFGTALADGVDGDLASNYGAITGDRPIYHDSVAAGQGSYRLDYAGDIDFDQVQLFNRVAAGVANTTSEYRVSILDGTGATVSSQLVTADGLDYDHVLDFSGTTGRAVLVEETNAAEFLAFAEVRVYGDVVPEPSAGLLSLLGGLALLSRRRRG